MSELHDIDRRVAVLEQIAADTRQALQDIRSELRGLREDVNRRLDTVDRRFASLESRAWRNFYWLIAGYAGLLAIISVSRPRNERLATVS